MFSPEGVIVPQGCLGRSEFANRIGGANSVPYNHASTLLGFWDMTTDGRTDDKRTDVGNQRISGLNPLWAH